MAIQHPTQTRPFGALVWRLAIGGLVTGGTMGALVGLIVASVSLGQPGDSFLRWFPCALALGGLLGGVSGQQLGRLRASRLVRSAPLLGALAGLVLGDIAWLAALLVAGDTATVSGTVGTVLSTSGRGLSTGLVLGAGGGILVGSITGCCVGGLILLAARPGRSLVRSRAAIIVGGIVLTLALTIGLVVLHRFLPAVIWLPAPQSEFFFGFFLAPRLLLALYVACAAAWLTQMLDAGRARR